MLSGHGQASRFLKSDPFLTEWVCKRLRVTKISSVLVWEAGLYSPQPFRFLHTRDLSSLVGSLHAIPPLRSICSSPTHTFLPLPFAFPGKACGGEVGGFYIDREPL